MLSGRVEPFIPVVLHRTKSTVGFLSEPEKRCEIWLTLYYCVLQPHYVASVLCNVPYSLKL